MGALATLIFAAAATLPHPAGIERWSAPIAEASARFGIPRSWIAKVMRAESGGGTRQGGRPIESPAGAMGLMQLMPGTWTALREAHGLGRDPHDPRDNILAGAAYLRSLYDRFGYPGLFAAYHAGPGRYAEHLETGRSLPPETIAYVEAITGRAAGDTSPPRTREDRIFFILPPDGAERSGSQAHRRRDDGGLFISVSGRVETR